MAVFVETAPHEFVANFLFNERGLFPFFAADRRVKCGGGSTAGTFTYDGERGQSRLSYQKSGIEHPGEETPEGTRFEIDTIREYRLNARSLDDEVGQRKFNVHLAPRWPGMRSKSGKEVPVAEGFGEGVNLRVTGANIKFTDYRFLIRRGFGAVDVQPEYFAEPHPYSNVQDAERYVRLQRDVSGPIHARSGPIAQLGHLLENDRNGYRKVVQNDQTGRGEPLPGYYHTVTLGQKRIQETLPSHELLKETKHYYAREVQAFPDDHPLSHSSRSVLSGQPVGGKNRNLHRLDRELDETTGYYTKVGATLIRLH